MSCTCGQPLKVAESKDRRGKPVWVVWCANLKCFPPKAVEHKDKATAEELWQTRYR